MSSEPKPLRLLNLPYVAQREVFKHFIPLEVLDLSLCSKKMTTIAKNNYNHCELQFQLTIFDRIVLNIYSRDNINGPFRTDFLLSWTREISEPKVRKINGLSVVYERGSEPTREISRWKTKEEAVEGASYYYKAIFDVFNIKYWIGLARKETAEDQYSTILSWIHQIQSKKDGEKQIINGQLLEDMVKYEIFHYHQVNIEQYEKDEIKHWLFHDALKMSVDNIFKLNFITLCLRSSSLTDKDLNLLIRRLLNECKERMEVMSIKVKRNMDQKVVLEGIDAHRVENIPAYERYGWNCPIEGELAYNIQLNDGRDCTINFIERLGGWSQIRIFIWRKEEA